ncbi:hypothetical protein V5799_006601 [Amblyomma americanum]|uniref:Transcription cofactor vestigial-like protein 2 n=1 Tax=Amblyomma americanum TaxID=6943 RepID=A0AAQ4DVX8_AMBAM
MHDLLAGSAAMAASPATPPSSLQSLGPQRSSSSSSSTVSSHHSRNHHSNHHSTANSSVVNSSSNSAGPPGGSGGGGRSSSSSSSCAVASSPSTPLAARSPDHDEPGQAGKASGGGSSASAIAGGGHASATVVTGGSSPPSTVAAGASSASSAAPGDAQYLSANCVVFTYYSGDISAVVDEHFSRALSETGAYDGSASCKSGASQLKDAPPMSQRNFPASFWNCHQTPSGGSPSHGMGGGVSSPVDLYTGSEPHAYHAHHAHHHASAANAAALHASLQSDPWHYALTAPQAGPYRSATKASTGNRARDAQAMCSFSLAPTRRSSAMHELAYSAGGAHRFGAAAQQYGSLLLQPRSSRLGSVSATCTALDKGDAWASPAARYHHDQLAAAAGHHVVDASGYQAAHHHYGSMGAAAAAAAMTGGRHFPWLACFETATSG